MTVWYAGREGPSRPSYQTVTYTEWHIPDVVLIQLILLMISTGLVETCRELKYTYRKKELSVKLVIYKNYTEMHGQQNIKLTIRIRRTWPAAYLLYRSNRFMFQHFAEPTKYCATWKNMVQCILIYVKVGPCHDGIARPQVADAGAASDMEDSCEYILNKQSQKADKGWSSTLGVGRGANNSSLLKRILLPNIHRQSHGHGLILWYELSNERGT